MSDSSQEFPGPVPEGETIIPPDLAFIEECMTSLAKDLEEMNWRLGKSILSRSEKWGTVWRVDIQTSVSKNIFRMAFFRRAGETTGFGTAFFSQQPIVPFE